MIAAIRTPSQVEKILRHVGLWRQPEADDNGEEDHVVAIRGPPGEDLYPADDEPAPDDDQRVPGGEGLDWLA